MSTINNRIPVEELIFFIRPLMQARPSMRVVRRNQQNGHIEQASAVFFLGWDPEDFTEYVDFGNFGDNYNYVMNGQAVYKLPSYTISNLMQDLLPMIGKGIFFPYRDVCIQNNCLLFVV